MEEIKTTEEQLRTVLSKLVGVGNGFGQFGDSLIEALKRDLINE